MSSRKLCLAAGLLLLGACSVDGSDASTADEKLAARLRLEGTGAGAPGDSASTTNTGGADVPASAPAARDLPADECQQHKWYGDGECDAWCPKGDAKDCAPSGAGPICALFFALADGYCNPDDPCGPVQDEDCQKGADGTSCGPTTPRPQPGDGKCEAKTLAELKADPDCASLACPAIFSPADGKCEPRTPCDLLIDEDCGRSGSGGGSSGSPGTVAPTPADPIVCIDIAYATNGKCEAAKGCEANDAVDCLGSTVCDAIAYPTNGKCEAPRGCEANDASDCHGSVACIEIAYPANGKCEAARGCEYTDPDCAVACITILYPKDGKCSAAKGCESSDPDC